MDEENKNRDWKKNMEEIKKESRQAEIFSRVALYASIFSLGMATSNLIRMLYLCLLKH